MISEIEHIVFGKVNLMRSDQNDKTDLYIQKTIVVDSKQEAE
jgi:hypothetical protein